MKKMFLFIAIALLSLPICAQVALDSAGRQAEYVRSVIGRSQKIVDNLGLTDEAVKVNVLHIICNRYFLLSAIHDATDRKIKEIKAGSLLDKDKKQHIIDNLLCERDAELYKHHFEFEACLANFLDDSQVEAVKDGMTYHVVKVTYDATLDMIPTLQEEEKRQILNWLKEAREFAMDAGDSKAKHGWFGKYKGRINNWLSSRGYNLVKEREAWYKRMEQKKQK